MTKSNRSYEHYSFDGDNRQKILEDDFQKKEIDHAATP